jgi:outer membrane protein assembly factor BamB
VINVKKQKGSRYTAIIFIVFLLSMALLAREIFFTYHDLPVSGRSGGEGELYHEAAQVGLGQVEVKDYQRMGFTRGIVRFANNGKSLAVGTENGDILLVNLAGKILWQTNLGLGKISALEFSHDSQSLLVGESSAEGNLYCFEAATGKERWRHSAARELGVDIKVKSLPGVVRIVEDHAGNVYMLAQRTERLNGKNSVYHGRIYSYNRHGQERWIFPGNGEMDAWVNWLSADSKGERLVFGTANFETDTTYTFGDNVYCLAGETGAQLWNIPVPPVPPYQKTVMRASPNIAADGKYLAAMASDGRGFLYDTDGKLLWQRTLSQPKKIAGVYLNSVGRDAFIVNDHVIFGTTNTYNNANWQLPTPIEHPSSNSMFIFSLAGQMKAHWRAEGAIEEMAFSQDKILAAVGRNTKTKDPKAHGLCVLSQADGLPLAFLPTEGPAIAAAISPDGNYLAGIEAPIQLDDGQIIGKYRLLLWSRS